jgi:succinyl-CoA synthetase beta subunit/citryl-CoA synthetase large subunit
VFSLTEDRTKQWLAKAGLPVPGGAAAGTAAEAVKIAGGFSGGAVVKALVPTGRRGKADAVRLVATAEEAGTAAEALLGTEVNGYPVARVYVEERVDIAAELYLSFSLDLYPPKILLSRQGGVDIEQTHRTDPDAIVTADIDPLAGVDADGAAALWRDAGADTDLLPKLGELTAGLYKAFVAADAAMLELNPIAVTGAGALSLVGAMMGVDENGLPRHEDWAEEADGSLIAAWRRFNERELRVAEANRTIKGGAIRYTELDGDIALLVGGGGAGLLQHDMMLAMGGRPANHTDTNPGAGIEEKFRVVVRSILDNPQAKCLLVSFNHQQLTRCDRKVIPLLDVLRERNVDAEKFPIMIRLVGPGEEEARALAAEYPGIIYLPTDASLDDAVRKAVEVCNGLTAKGAAQ